MDKVRHVSDEYFAKIDDKVSKPVSVRRRLRTADCGLQTADQG